MKTLLFCTSYAERQAAWNERWGRWLKAIAHSGLEADKILIVDDGSPLLPDWPGVAVFPADPSIADDSRVAIHHFADCRGQRVNGEPFPGWYRSFAYAVLYGMDRGFDKIIHIEADAFLITDHIVNYFNSVDCGWIALWCRRHNWPESTFQIINSDQFEACRKFFSQPYSAHLGPPYRAPEQLIPFTLINKSFIGDRYGESEDTVPFDADYVSQVKWGRGPEYYWWLHEDGTRRMPDRALLAAGRPDTETGKAAKPRIVALTMAKNEQDIIEPFVRHTDRFVDYHVIIDNGSVDETRNILTALMRELDGVIVTPVSEFGYRQSVRMSRLLHLCQTGIFADYIIFLDADEFISCETREDFETYLARTPIGGFGEIPWRTFVLTPYDQHRDHQDPPRSMPWRRADEHKRNNVVLRLDGEYWHDLVIEQGSHRVSSTSGRAIPSAPLAGLYLNHFPVRSVDQFVGKSIVGWMAYLGKDPRAAQKGEGYHWHENFDLVIRGPKLSFEKLCDLSMRYDHPPREYDWARDVVRDDPPDDYERRYSSGLFADPLTLVANSWRASLEATEPLLPFARKDVTTAADGSPEPHTAFEPQWHWENPFADIPPFRYLFEKYQPQSILDVGCGVGAYLTVLDRLGAKVVFGVDGLPQSATMLGDAAYKQVDLSEPLELGRRFDVVMCLEVAEHIPMNLVDNLLSTIQAHAKGLIVFSAAEPGQPGHGHINCLPIGQWLERWRALGWSPLLSDTLALRAISTLAWFKRNLVVLHRGVGKDGDYAISELKRIGSLRYTWHHTDSGVRTEVLTGDVPHPPLGYQSRA